MQTLDLRRTSTCMCTYANYKVLKLLGNKYRVCIKIVLIKEAFDSKCKVNYQIKHLINNFLNVKNLHLCLMLMWGIFADKIKCFCM